MTAARTIARAALAGLAVCWPLAASAQGYEPQRRPFALDEVRLGLLWHNIDHLGQERGYNINGELLFASPFGRWGNPILDIVFRPRAHLGGSWASDGGTNQLYWGATWTVPLGRSFFAELSFGGAWHDGPITFPALTPVEVASYGCRVNFRESASLGMELTRNWRVMLMIDHMSNANLCEDNTGLTNAGIRVGYKLD